MITVVIPTYIYMRLTIQKGYQISPGDSISSSARNEVSWRCGIHIFSACLFLGSTFSERCALIINALDKLVAPYIVVLKIASFHVAGYTSTWGSAHTKRQCLFRTQSYRWPILNALRRPKGIVKTRAITARCNLNRGPAHTTKIRGTHSPLFPLPGMGRMCIYWLDT